MMKFAILPALSVLLLAPLGGALAQNDNSINITLTNYAFTPSALNLTTGTIYHLHFVNNGSKDHNFSAPEFFAGSEIAPEDQTKVENGLVALESGQSADITLTPGRSGTFAAECTHFMHKMMGMHGTITVR